MEHHSAGPGLSDLFALINFLVVGAILYFGGRKAIAAALRARQEGISKGLIEAARELKNTQGLIKQARTEMANLDKMKKGFIDELTLEGQNAYKKIVQEAELASQRILQDAKLAAENEIRDAALKVKNEIVQKAVMRAASLGSAEGGAETQKRIHEKLIENFLGDLKSQKDLNGV